MTDLLIERLRSALPKGRSFLALHEPNSGLAKRAKRLTTTAKVPHTASYEPRQRGGGKS
jgi:hypothetical protein